MTTARQCFYIPYDQFDDRGYIPSLVTENEFGHAPLTGSGELSAPWYWGKTYEEAQETARNANLELGLTDDDVTTIVASSMARS